MIIKYNNLNHLNMDKQTETAAAPSDNETEYAQIALDEFKKKNYSTCLQNINKLEKRSGELKVLHNKYVAELYKSDMKKLDQFQKHISSLFETFHLKRDVIDDVDHAVLYYNMALLLFKQRKYHESLTILEKIYKFIEPMEESLSQHVCLLLLEINIILKQVDKAWKLLNYLQNQNSHLLVNTSIKSPKAERKKCSEAITPETKAFIRKLETYRIRCNLLFHNLTMSRDDCIKLYDNEKNIESIFLMANQHFLEGNFEESIKLINSISIKARDNGESVSVMVNNNLGVLYHTMGKPNLACMHYHLAINDEMENIKITKQSTRYHELVYNSGISLLHAGKPQDAFDCLLIAARRYHRNARLWLRLAECCMIMHQKSNDELFDLQKKQNEFVVDIIGSGEWRKVILTTSLSTGNKYNSNNTSYAVPVPTLEFASLCLRNALLLLPSIAPNTANDVTQPLFTDSSQSESLLAMATAAAASTESTASASPISSSSSSSTKSISAPDLKASSTATTGNCTPGAPVRSSRAVDELRNATLAASAYVSLYLGDFILALEHAKALLAQPRLSTIHKVLGHLYAAESLMMLDKITEAIDHLDPENLADLSKADLSLDVANPDSDSNLLVDDVKLNARPPQKWYPDNKDTVFSVLQYNIAVAKAIRGQLDHASDILKQIWTTRKSGVKIPAHIIMLVLYIELQLGHIDAARALIRQYRLNIKSN